MEPALRHRVCVCRRQEAVPGRSLLMEPDLLDWASLPVSYRPRALRATFPLQACQTAHAPQVAKDGRLLNRAIFPPPSGELHIPAGRRSDSSG
jgi:hypothetical protein